MSIFSKKKEMNQSVEQEVLNTYKSFLLVNNQNLSNQLQLLNTQIRGFSDLEIYKEIQSIRKSLIITKQSHESLYSHIKEQYSKFKQINKNQYSSKRYLFEKLDFYLPIKLLNQRSNFDREVLDSFININFEILSSYQKELKSFIKYLSENI